MQRTPGIPLAVWLTLYHDPIGDFDHVQGTCDLEMLRSPVSSFSAGAEDQCALDPVLWHPQCFRARVQLDPGAPGPGGLWDRRGPPVVSKDPALATQPGSQPTMFMASEGCKDGTYARASGIQGLWMEPENGVIVSIIMITNSKSNTVAGRS